MSQNGTDAVYEMLWDCKFCGQKKLLGLTHRFCAGCGAPQDPNTRYFPSDEEKIAVKDSPFVGADVQCPACRQPMSRAATNCTNCGSPLAAGQQVALRPDVGPAQPIYAAPLAPPAKSNLGLILGIVGGFLALVVIGILVAVFWKREGVFAVSGHTWERDIAVETYGSSRKSVWCDSVPTNAHVVNRYKAQNGTDKQPDGETCSTTKKDQGNGTFKEVKTCTPKYKETPHMQDKCDIDVTEWKTERTATAKGDGLTPAPSWPTTNITRPGACLGCEREGARTEHYIVNFTKTKSTDTATCEVTQDKWQSFGDGSQWKGRSGVLTGSLDCDQLSKP